MNTTHRRRSGQLAVPILQALAAVALALFSYFWGRRAMQKPATSQEVVVEQVQKVAQLVSTRVNVRDILEYHDRKHFSTRRVLMVVRGHLNVGIDLKDNPPPRIDELTKEVTVSLPHATILDVVQEDPLIYDVRQGLFNRFSLEDASWLHHSTDSALRVAGAQFGIAEHADSSAARTLRALLQRDGYAVRVSFRD